MGDGTEPIPRLDESARKRICASVNRCGTLKELRHLEVNTWRTYESRRNETALHQLTLFFDARREALKRNNPR